MKNLLFLFLLIPSFLFSQIQVSDIDYKLTRDDYYRKGFIKVENQEYFVEQGVKGTKVSLVTDGNLEFIHELQYRPTDSSPDWSGYSYDKSNSGLIYDGPILYELYNNYIYMINIVTGDLVEVYDLKPYGLRFNRDFHYGENYLCFNTYLSGSNVYVRLDKNNGALDTLVDLGVIANDRRFHISDDKTALSYLDLETNEFIELSYRFDEIQFVTGNYVNSSAQLTIKDLNNILLLNTDDTIESLDCDVPPSSTLQYVSDTHIAYLSTAGLGDIFGVMDRATCSVIYTKQFLNNTASPYFYVHTNKQLNGEYFMFGYSNDWQGYGDYYLYDVAANIEAPIDIPIDLPQLNQAVRYGNNLYFNTYDDIHYIGYRPELYRLDLSTYQTERISNEEIFETWSIVVGESQGGEKLNVYYRTEDTGILYQIDNEEQNLELTEELDLLKNHGIYSNINRDLWVGDKYFFSTSKAIFVMENDQTTKLLDLGPPRYNSSAFVVMDQSVYFLGGIDSAHYAIKVDKDNLSYSTTLLPELESINHQGSSSENAIVNLSINYPNASSDGFFDLVTEEFISFESLVLLAGRGKYLSGNNILYQTSYTSGKKWFIINTITREVILTEIEEGTYPDPYPDGNGGFYLDGWTYADEVSFSYVDNQGKVTEIFKKFDYELFSGSNKFDGEVKSLAFKGDNELIIISTKNGEVRRKFISSSDELSSYYFNWHESDQLSILNLYNGTNYDTYQFTFDTDPVNITPGGRVDPLIRAIHENNASILVYYNIQDKLLSFEKYDHSTGIIAPISDISSIKANGLGRTFVKIKDGMYLISIDDGIHGLEPWTINTTTGALTLLKDMHVGIGSSDIDDFTINPISEEVYFTAEDDQQERQLYRFDELLNPVTDYNISNLEISISPIPACDFISLDQDFSNISIMSYDGRLVSELRSYTQGSTISVANLTEGMYVLVAQLKDKKVKVGKFIIQR